MQGQWVYLAAVALGSAFGGVLRFLAREYLPRWIPVDFPIGTLAVNFAGCLLAGYLLVYWQNSHVSPVIKAALMIGFLGALTTFSSFSVDTLVLIQDKQMLKAALNILFNVTFSLIAVFFGAWIGGRITQS